MEHDRFVELTNEIFYDVGMLLNSKNEEYARGGDKLHNFKKAASFLKSKKQVEALRGMLLKHTVSIYDMMDDHIEGKKKGHKVWREKVYDHIAYLVILMAMIEEEEEVYRTTNYSVRIPIPTHTANCNCDICSADDLTPSDSER